MLFDLRSRGRRRTVQVIYAVLALVMLSGLVLFGVGAGNGIGGLLNAFTNNGSSTSNNGAISQQTRHALKLTRENPNSAHAWFALLQARYAQAGSGNNFNSTTGVYTAAGLAQLKKAGDAWQEYLKRTQNPSSEAATLAARAYSTTGNWKDGAVAWEFVAQAEPTASSAFICLAASAYAAKQTRKGDLAKERAIALAPKLQRLNVKKELETAKTSTSVAQSCG